MARTYEQITEDQMEDAVAAFKRGPDRRGMNPNQETTYDWMLGARNGTGPKLAVRLYSSVVPSQGEARGCGEDAIRVAVVASPGTRSERLLLTLKRVHRTPGWAKRMRRRLTDAWLLVRRSPPCPACGGYMTPRAVRADKADRRSPVKRMFWSCSSNNCRGSRAAQKLVDGHTPKTVEQMLESLPALGAPVKPAPQAPPSAPPQAPPRAPRVQEDPRDGAYEGLEDHPGDPSTYGDS